MSSFPRRAGAMVAGALLATSIGRAATPDQTAPIPKAYLRIWQAEATDFGKHPPREPAHQAGYYGIGTTPSPRAIERWSIAILPTGAGLPPGQGTVADGETLYFSKCAMCHGTFAQGKHGYPALAGGVGSLTGSSQTKTPGSYWPFATTIWDYIDRAMPFYAPHTLKPDQVYALTAYLLDLNGIVASGFVADAHSIAAVKMPDLAHWTWRDPRPVTHNTACMADCARPGSSRVTSNADTTSLTPRLTGKVDHMKSPR